MIFGPLAGEPFCALTVIDGEKGRKKWSILIQSCYSILNVMFAVFEVDWVQLSRKSLIVLHPEPTKCFVT